VWPLSHRVELPEEFYAGRVHVASSDTGFVVFEVRTRNLLALSSCRFCEPAWKEVDCTFLIVRRATSVTWRKWSARCLARKRSKCRIFGLTRSVARFLAASYVRRLLSLPFGCTVSLHSSRTGAPLIVGLQLLQGQLAAQTILKLFLHAVSSKGSSSGNLLILLSELQVCGCFAAVAQPSFP
jgi:hypothetical protein